jgi:hypothetical protein
MRPTVNAARTARARQPAGQAAGGGGPVDEADLKLVTVMPLHAVTAMYGEQGLRARFAA